MSDSFAWYASASWREATFQISDADADPGMTGLALMALFIKISSLSDLHLV
jgi:hypothetical protein